MSIRARLLRRIRDRGAQGLLEYFLLIGAVAILTGVAIFTFGGNLGQTITLGQKCVQNITSTAAIGDFSSSVAGPCG